MAKGKYKRKRFLRQRQQISVCDSGMSTRVAHRLENAGIMTLRDLDLYPEAKLETISGIGEASLKEIRTYCWNGILKEGIPFIHKNTVDAL